MPANPNYKLIEFLLNEGDDNDAAKDELIRHLLAIAPELVRAHKFAAKRPKLKEVGRVFHMADTTQRGILNTHCPEGAKLYIEVPA